jgi:hypothetical protein
MQKAKLPPQLRKLLVPAQGYQSDKHTSSCTFAPNPKARRPWQQISVVLHELQDVMTNQKQLTGALQQTAVQEQLEDAILLAHQQLQNKVIDAQQKPSALDRDEDQQQQQQQQQESCWQANMRLEHIGPGHRAYQKQQQQQQPMEQHAAEGQPQPPQQPLCAIANRSFKAGDFIGFYLSNVLDDQLYELGGTVEERAYRQYIHHFSVTQPAFAVRCEQELLWLQQQQQKQQQQQEQQQDTADTQQQEEEQQQQGDKQQQEKEQQQRDEQQQQQQADTQQQEEQQPCHEALRARCQRLLLRG